MNSKYETLIRELRVDGRKKLTEISLATGIPVSTLFDMLNKLEKQKTVRHKTLVNFEHVGYPVRLMLMLKTSPAQRESLRSYLADHQSMNSLYKINSGFDYLVDAVFPDAKEAQDFIDAVELKNAIIEKKVLQVIDVIHQEKFLSEERRLGG